MLSKQQLDKLTKAEIVQYALDLSDLHVKLDALEKTFAERIVAGEKQFTDQLKAYEEQTNAVIDDLKSQLEVSKNTSSVLRDNLKIKTDEINEKMTTLERQVYRSAEYLNYETLEISKIPLTIPNDQVQDVRLKVINALYDKTEGR